MHRACLLVLLALPAAWACAHTYTHRRGMAETPAACHYNHVEAGRDWPDHDKECSWTCGGHSQSPINVPMKGNKVLDKKFKANLNFGLATNISVLNVGHAIQVEFNEPIGNKASVVYYGDSIYTLYNASSLKASKAHRVKVEPLQFHFHSTSEHLLSGQSTLLEFHLVTKLVKTPGVPMPKECATEDKTCLAVFGVMYDLKSDPTAVKGDKLVKTILKWLPKNCPSAGRDCVSGVPHWEIDLSELIPSSHYFTYTGSLTTPPCSEGVMWHVFGRVKATLTEQQALDLQTALSTATLDGETVGNRVNNRVTQAWNGRTVFVSA
ncbi:hypothetical protein ABPG77_005571 [Micractinium sp. CCAP 211/92]